MADIYISVANGNDTTGDGTIGTPLATIQKGLDDYMVAGDIMYIGNTTKTTLTTGLSMSLVGGTVDADNPLRFRPYDDGGALSITMPGGNVDAWEVDGNDAVANIWNTTSLKNWVYIENAIYHGTTSYVVNAGTNWRFWQCEIYDGNATALLDGATNCHYESCIIRDSGGTGVDGIEGDGAGNYIHGCYISGLTGVGVRAGNYNRIFDNVFGHCTEACIMAAVDHGIIRNNAFIGDGSASEIGIDFLSAAVENIDIYIHQVTYLLRHTLKIRGNLTLFRNLSAWDNKFIP